MLARSVKSEHALRDRHALGIDLDCVFELVVSIAQRWPARVDALFGLLAHSLADFLAQVLDVVSGDHNLNAMHELGLRFRVLADDLALFRQMNFDLQIFQRHAIAEVAVESVGLLHDGDAAGRIFPKETDHLSELSAACDLGRLYVHELMCDLEVMRPGILPQQLQLRGNGVALALLVFAGNSGVNDGLFHACLHFEIISHTMRSWNFRVKNCHAFLGGISRRLLVSAVPFIEQHEHPAKCAQGSGVKSLSSCGRVSGIAQGAGRTLSRGRAGSAGDGASLYGFLNSSSTSPQGTN